MLFVTTSSSDPRTNLALEEFLLRHASLEEMLLLFYVNEPAVIIGRNQNAFEEVDPDYLAANGIQLVRRLSGGGTVYHDPGNLNFSFISPERDDLHNFAKFTDPIVAVLDQLGVKADLRHRSSLFVGDEKISGNAQYVSRGRVLSHGTLLFDTDLEQLNRAVRPRPLSIQSQAVQSVRANVTNIRDLLPRPMTLAQFQQMILHHLFGETISTLALTAVDWAKIEQIRAERYESWDWNIGRSPKFTVRRSSRLPAGRVAIEIEVVNGRVRYSKIEADFIDSSVTLSLESSLVGCRYERKSLQHVVQSIPTTPVEILDFLY